MAFLGHLGKLKVDYILNNSMWFLLNSLGVGDSEMWLIAEHLYS